jgi:hypothetical protein
MQASQVGAASHLVDAILAHDSLDKKLDLLRRAFKDHSQSVQDNASEMGPSAAGTVGESGTRAEVTPRV